MQISDAFPSNYLKAADLQGRNVTVKIDRVEQEKIGTDTKLVLYFQGKEKGMVLNKTNANNIAFIYGQETDEWQGAEVTLFEAMVDYQGKTVPAIRVRGPQRKANGSRNNVQTSPQRMKENPQPYDDFNDDVPGF